MPGIYNLHINATTLRATRSPRGGRDEGSGPSGSSFCLFWFQFGSVRFGEWGVGVGAGAGAATCGRRTQIKMLISVKRSCAGSSSSGNNSSQKIEQLNGSQNGRKERQGEEQRMEGGEAKNKINARGGSSGPLSPNYAMAAEIPSAADAAVVVFLNPIWYAAAQAEQ